MDNRQELDKMAQGIWAQGELAGRKTYHIFKAASAGDPQYIQFVKQAQEMADAAGMEAEMAGEPMGAPVAEDGSAPGTVGPAGIMMCPVCGAQMTPTLDMTCPACGSDISQAVNEAISPQQPPMPMPAPEQVQAAEEQMVQAAVKDQNVMEMLLTHYGHLVR